MASVIPLQPVASQTVAVQLNGQNCQLNVYQTAYGLAMDVYVAGKLIIGGVLCWNQNVIVRDLYFGFQGDFWFYDNTGAGNDPYYTGLGGAAANFSLIYLTPADLNGQG